MSRTENTEIPQQKLETIAVVGAGTMGHGIAQVAREAGYSVLMCDLGSESVWRGIRPNHGGLQTEIARGKLPEADFDRVQVKPLMQIVPGADMKVNTWCVKVRVEKESD